MLVVYLLSLLKMQCCNILKAQVGRWTGHYNILLIFSGFQFIQSCKKYYFLFDLSEKCIPMPVVTLDFRCVTQKQMLVFATITFAFHLASLGFSRSRKGTGLDTIFDFSHPPTTTSKLFSPIGILYPSHTCPSPFPYPFPHIIFFLICQKSVPNACCYS